MDWAKYFEDLAINSGIGAILSAVKNPQHAARLRGVLLHVMEVICATYGLIPPTHD